MVVYITLTIRRANTLLCEMDIISTLAGKRRIRHANTPVCEIANNLQNVVLVPPLLVHQFDVSGGRVRFGHDINNLPNIA